MFGGGSSPANMTTIPVTAGGIGGVQSVKTGSVRCWQKPCVPTAVFRATDIAPRDSAATSACEPGCRQLDNKAFNRSSPAQQRVAHNVSQQVSRRGRAPSVSILPMVSPSEDAEDAQGTSWNDEINDLKELGRSLKRSGTMDEKMAVLDSCKRVQRVFGSVGSGMFVQPAVVLALHTLDQTELYLIKCLVAAGQEHVLDVPFSWAGEFDAIVEESDGNLSGTSSFVMSTLPQGHLLKDAFLVVAQMIDGWDISGRKPVHSKNGALGVSAGNCCEGSSWIGHDSGVPGQLRGLLARLVKVLAKLEKFYDCVGGIIGYQVTVLELIRASELQKKSASKLQKTIGGHCSREDWCFCVPAGPDLSADVAYAGKAALWGLQGLPQMGEIYPLGGAGDRLGLVDDVTGECLPVAMLPYGGRTLLEGLIRDLQAREYLHFRVFGERHFTPVAIMTSSAKRNHERVLTLCERLGWFGRGRGNFRVFEQPLVPTVAAADGHWLIHEPLTAVLKPGGHGVIWKLARDFGVFEWFRQKGRKAAIVRQISNPVAGTDVTLLALSGIGLQHNNKFGFASCKRNVGTAEGVNVLVEKKTWDGAWEYGVTCIEYTEFSKLGIPDVPISSGSMEAQYPANTNVLYVDLAAVEKVASSHSAASLPGMILNLKKPAVFEDYLGQQHSILAGRLECTMQNIADYLTNISYSRQILNSLEDLDTFVTYNQRRKVTSSAKRRRKHNEQSLHQTPDGSFLDVTRNAYDMLRSCGVEMPLMESNYCYIDVAPPFMVSFHPALGPLWDVIRQKIRGGSIAESSELQLEIAELLWENVQLDGSLIVQAQNVMGTVVDKGTRDQILRYGDGCGRCRLERVKIVNNGVDWTCVDNIYWQRKLKRFESLEIVLEGDSQFEAFDVVFKGPQSFHVPDGYKLSVVGTDAGFSTSMEPLSNAGSWSWTYARHGDSDIRLTFQET